MQNARKRYNPKTLCDITESHFSVFLLPLHPKLNI